MRITGLAPHYDLPIMALHTDLGERVRLHWEALGGVGQKREVRRAGQARRNRRVIEWHCDDKVGDKSTRYDMNDFQCIYGTAFWKAKNRLHGATHLAI